MHKLESMLKKTNLTIILVYADWCGHCHTYKDTVWKQLEQMSNKKVGLAKLNEKVLADSPLSGAKINGYPSVLVVGKDGKPAEFKDESTGEATNAMPNTRDLDMMKGLVRGANKPNSVLNDNMTLSPYTSFNVTRNVSPNASKVDMSVYPKTIYIGKESNVTTKAANVASKAANVASNEEESDSDSDSDEEDSNININIGSKNSKNMNSSNMSINGSKNSSNMSINEGMNSSNMSINEGMNSSNMNISANKSQISKNSSAILIDSESPVSSKILPPSAEDDLLTPVSASGPMNSSQLGGSLYMALLDAAKATAPAALLTAAAAMKSRRSRKSLKLRRLKH